MQGAAGTAPHSLSGGAQHGAGEADPDRRPTLPPGAQRLPPGSPPRAVSGVGGHFTERAVALHDEVASEPIKIEVIRLASSRPSASGGFWLLLVASGCFWLLLVASDCF